MGAYNEVRARVCCPNCHNFVDTDIQFKHGNTNGFRYKMGDTITWGGNAIGSKEVGKIVVEGEATICAICGYDGEWPILLTIENNVLLDATTDAAHNP